VLNLEKTYLLAEAYEDNLHILFANANSDQKLVDFIRAWGPLYIPLEKVPPDGVISLPLSFCRAFQQEIKSLVAALTAFKRGTGEREALERLIDADNAVLSASNQDEELSWEGWSKTKFMVNELGISGDVLAWSKRAPLREVRTAMDFLVRYALPVSCSIKLLHRGRGRRVEAGWDLPSMKDAMLWMVWYDEFTKHPLICCQECRTIFRGETAHVRKYCPGPCAHRATAREWQRRRRVKDRRNHGTPKTR
jgi:hypothetical protein